MIHPLVDADNPILRQVARPALPEYGIRGLIDDLIQTMVARKGMGLAAPQIGVSLRVAVISTPEASLVLVNPEVVRIGRERSTQDEGCLSLPGVLIPVERANRITVRSEGQAYNLSGLTARVAQHELDHLDGKLITDYEPSPLRAMLRT